MELPKPTIESIDRQVWNPNRLSSRVLRYMLGQLAVYEASSEAERAETIRARIEYELHLRDGQGN